MEKKTKSLFRITTEANTTQNNPAKAVVVNFGVSLRHLKDTENNCKQNHLLN